MARKAKAVEEVQSSSGYKFNWRTARVRLTGVSPLIMHNATELVDPISPTMEEIRSITSKKKKTADDYWAKFKLEWKAGLWLNPEGRIVIPRNALLAMVRDSAKTWNDGKEITRSAEVPNDALLEYDGPNDPEKLWERGPFRDVRSVKVQQSRVMRCRPIFRQWAVEFDFMWLAEFVDEHMINQYLANGGFRIGIGDFRPYYGRFKHEIVATA